mmetsp:Transcript_44028/g.51572  ORF Transcript_44028/g.51572 Transcript_44028/m.51572 type:complete len:235 (+) Transcript_44028:118-822(+)
MSCSKLFVRRWSGRSIEIRWKRGRQARTSRRRTHARKRRRRSHPRMKWWRHASRWSSRSSRRRTTKLWRRAVHRWTSLRWRGPVPAVWVLVRRRRRGTSHLIVLVAIIVIIMLLVLVLVPVLMHHGRRRSAVLHRRAPPKPGSSRRRRHKPGPHPGSLPRLVHIKGGIGHLVHLHHVAVWQWRGAIHALELEKGLLGGGEAVGTRSPLVHVSGVVDLEILAEFPSAALLLSSGC